MLVCGHNVEQPSRAERKKTWFSGWSYFEEKIE